MYTHHVPPSTRASSAHVCTVFYSNGNRARMRQYIQYIYLPFLTCIWWYSVFVARMNVCECVCCSAVCTSTSTHFGCCRCPRQRLTASKLKRTVSSAKYIIRKASHLCARRAYRSFRHTLVAHARVSVLRSRQSTHARAKVHNNMDFV